MHVKKLKNMIKMKDNTFKMIIIGCLIAIVCIFGVLAYSFVSANNKAPALNNASNQSLQNNSNSTNGTGNVTKTVVKTVKSKTNLISAQRAIDIVEESCPGGPGDTRFGAQLINNNGAPYYLVTAYDDNSSSSTYGEGIGGAKVDARTGVILDEMG